MSDYMPKTEDGLLTWSANFVNRLLALAPTFGITADEVEAAGRKAKALQTAIHKYTEARALAAAALKVKEEMIDMQLPVLRALARRIKTHEAYTAAIGKELDIIGSIQEVDTTTYTPVLRAEAHPGYVILRFAKKGVDGVNIYARLKGEVAWQKLSYDSYSPYIDNRETVTPGKPDNREYMCIGVLKDAEIGQQSDIVHIAFAG